MITRFLALAALVSRPVAIQAFNPALSFASSPFNTAVRMSSTSTEMKKRVLVPIAEDSEEIETSCITDVLTRFGAEVVVASVMPDNLVCKMSRGLKVCADIHIEEAANDDWDMISLPGEYELLPKIVELIICNLNEQLDFASHKIQAVCPEQNIYVIAQHLLKC